MRISAPAGSSFPDFAHGPQKVEWLIVLPNLQAGGAQRVLVNIANELARRGNRVNLVLLGERSIDACTIHETIKVDVLGKAKFWKHVAAVRRVLKASPPRFCLSSTVMVNLIVLAALPLNGGPSVIVREANTFSRWVTQKRRRIRWFVSAMVPLLYRRASYIVANSERSAADLADFLKVAPERVRVLPNALDLSGIRAASDMPPHPAVARLPRPIVLAVGRLAEGKDFRTLIRAVARTPPNRVGSLCILGEGPERRDLESHVASLGAADRVWMPGYVGNPYAWMRAADVVVLSSKWEGCPNVLLEAMALGCRIVSTDCPSGPSEILENGRFGALVEVGNVDELAGAIEEAVRRAPSFEMRRHVERYSSRCVVDQLLELVTAQPQSMPERAE